MMNDNRRNYSLMFLDTILFVNAMAFLSINAVIPSFLSELGANTFEISLASALVSIGAFLTQPLFAQMAMGMPVKHKAFSGILALQRVIFILYILSMPFLTKVSPNLSIILFLVFWGVFNLFVGSYSPFFMSILSKIIAGHQRGRLIGFSGAAGNVIALGAAFLVGLILKNMTFPYNYAWVFGIGAFLLLLDAGDFFLLREPTETVQKRRISYLDYIRNMPLALKEYPGFAKAVAGNGFIVVANVALAYYTLYAIRNYQAGPEDVAVFTGITVVFNTLGSAVFGVVGDRYGHRYVLMGAAAFGVLAAAVVLSISSLYAVYAAFALSSLCVSGYNISCSMHVIQNSPQDQIPLYVSINMMITLVISSLITLLGGIVIDGFSFVPVFALTGVSALLGLAALRFSRGDSL